MSLVFPGGQRSGLDVTASFDYCSRNPDISLCEAYLPLCACPKRVGSPSVLPNPHDFSKAMLSLLFIQPGVNQRVNPLST